MATADAPVISFAMLAENATSILAIISHSTMLTDSTIPRDPQFLISKAKAEQIRGQYVKEQIRRA